MILTDHNLSTPRKIPLKNEFLKKLFNLIKKIKPSQSEVIENTRSRSAKINVLEKSI